MERHDTSLKIVSICIFKQRRYGSPFRPMKISLVAMRSENGCARKYMPSICAFNLRGISRTRMDTLTNIKAFLRVARTLSFVRAADQLGVAASVVSKRVRQLEEALGARLFERTTHTVSLTDVGERMLGELASLDTQFNEVLQRVNEYAAPGLSGTLRIKLPISFALMGFDRLLGRFQREHPQIELDVVVVDRTVDPVEEGFDVSLHGGVAQFDAVIDEPLVSYQRVIVGSPVYLNLKGAPSTPYDLEHHDCLMLDREGGVLRFITNDVPVVVRPHVWLVSNSLLGLIGAVKEGCGLLVIPSPLLEVVDQDRQLIRVLPSERLSDRWISAHVPANRQYSAKVRAFLDFVKVHRLDALRGGFNS